MTLLAYLCLDQRPALLGPLISVCYWHDDCWRVSDNPAPLVEHLEPRAWVSQVLEQSRAWQLDSEWGRVQTLDIGSIV